MLLVNPSSGYYYFLPSAGIGYLASVLENRGDKVRVIDAQYERNYERKILEELEYHESVGLSVNCGNVKRAIAISKLVRNHRPATRIIMGGPYASIIFHRLIPEIADIVVRGEGEQTVLEIANEQDLNAIKGISFWDGNDIVSTPSREHIADLDSIPFPAWHYFDLGRYNFPARKWPSVPIITSRGCPYRCINCTHGIHGYRFRYRSPENVVSEIDYLLRRYGVREIQIWDDNFTLIPDRVKEICEFIIKKNIKVDISIPNGIRADVGDEEMFNLMKKAGFYLVSLGVESGVQEIVDQLGKKLVLQRVRETVKILNKVGIKINLFIMIGLPWDTKETMQRSIDFAKSLKVNLVHFQVTMPFPGTELFEMVKNQGRFLHEPEAFYPTYQGKELTYEVYDLKATDVREMVRKAYVEFYLRPSQAVRFLNKKIKYRKSIRGLWAFGKRIICK